MSGIMMPMKDGGIVSYSDSSNYVPGCENCDYGSQYITCINIALTKNEIHVTLDSMYEYAISEGDIMSILLPAYKEIRDMTEMEFVTWFMRRLTDKMKERYRYVDVEEVMREYTFQHKEGGAGE